ncbi:MAG: response regulator [Lentisphaerae bacterium]|nr:response regulator [Lentisphaerota bacterium]
MFWRKKPVKDEGSKHMVMLVDDDMPIRKCIGKLLEREGLEVITCADGQEAVETYTARCREIGIIILDMLMPRMDGRTAFHELKKLDPNVKVILSSGYSVTTAVQECLDAGALIFFHKPFQIGELMETIRQHIVIKKT